MFECLVLSSIIIKQGFHVARAEAPPHERDLASELRIAKMHHRNVFDIYIYIKTAGDSGEIEFAR